MDQSEVTRLVQGLRNVPAETEWDEFKQDNADAEQIGQYLSALANSSDLLHKRWGYIVWGIENDTHLLSGTRFVPSREKRGNQPLELFLTIHLTPRINFRLRIDHCASFPASLYGRFSRNSVETMSVIFT